MKKHFLKITFFFVFVFFLSPILAKADFGDLRYEITDVVLKDTTITFKGWAYIHKTNNFITVKSTDGRDIATNGGQKVIIQAYDGDKLIETSSNSVKEEDMYNYNFYCELYYDGISNCTEGRYYSRDFNSCTTNDSGCYYEDIYFEISFDTSTWNSDNIIFKIAASNNFFEENKINYNEPYEYEEHNYTKPEAVSIARAVIEGKTNNYIEITQDSYPSKVKFIAENGVLRNPSNFAFTFNDTTFGNGWDDKCNGKRIYELDISNETYPNARSKETFQGNCKDFLGDGCRGSYMYPIKIANPISYIKTNDVTKYIACPGTTGGIALAFGSHIKQEGKFTIKVKNKKKCTPVTPAEGNLECNNSKTYTSTCEELNIHTDKGSSNVKIEQTGIISSILTPDKIYEGGGFNFGILYTNTIKWSYSNGKEPNSELHKTITDEMNKRLYDYNNYKAGLNISNLKFGGETKDSNFLFKECKSSNDENIDYYNKELTVSCVFYLPESDILQNGDVEYNDGAEGLGISNKYYTLLGHHGKYEISANIEGMNRIKESYTKTDSSDDITPWTGTWEDTFTNCNITVYPLYSIPPGWKEKDEEKENYTGSKKIMYNFIYRPIDITNPFPNRNAGINWFEWWAIQKNKDVLKETYSNEPQYSITLDNQTISEIKKYNLNSQNGYFDWDTMKNGESTFVNEYFDKVGDNS